MTSDPHFIHSHFHPIIIINQMFKMNIHSTCTSLHPAIPPMHEWIFNQDFWYFLIELTQLHIHVCPPGAHPNQITARESKIYDVRYRSHFRWPETQEMSAMSRFIPILGLRMIATTKQTKIFMRKKKRTHAHTNEKCSQKAYKTTVQNNQLYVCAYVGEATVCTSPCVGV